METQRKKNIRRPRQATPEALFLIHRRALWFSVALAPRMALGHRRGQVSRMRFLKSEIARPAKRPNFDAGVWGSGLACRSELPNCANQTRSSASSVGDRVAISCLISSSVIGRKVAPQINASNAPTVAQAQDIRDQVGRLADGLEILSQASRWRPVLGA
jgi:hypothetical protein